MAWGADLDGCFDAAQAKSLVESVIAQCLALLEPHNRNIRGIAFSCFVGNILGVNAAGQPATPVYCYANRSPTASAALVELRMLLDGASYHDRCGAPLHPAYAPCQILQHRARSRAMTSSGEEPSAWCSLVTWIISTWVAASSDGPLAGLLGLGMSPSEASWAGLANLQSGGWDGPTLAALGLHASQLPPIRSASEPVATVGITGHATAPQTASPAFKALLEGTGTDVVSLWLGLGDGAAAHIGSGALQQQAFSLTVRCNPELL